MYIINLIKNLPMKREPYVPWRKGRGRREGSSKGTVGSLEKIDLLFSQQTISISNKPTSKLTNPY